MGEAGVVGDAQFNTCILYILISMSLGEIFRALIRQIYADPKVLPRVLLHEIVTTFEKVAIVYELQIIVGGYGKGMYYTIFFLYTMWLNSRKDPTKSSASYHITNLIDGKTHMGMVVGQTCLELLTGFIVYPLYVKPLWSLARSHPVRLRKLTNLCNVDLTVSTGYGFGIESGGSFVLQLAPMILSHFVENEAMAEVINCTILVWIVHLGIDASGAWYSPTLATIIQAGCNRMDVVQHILIYWVGCISATALAIGFYRSIRDMMGWDSEKKD